MIKAVVLTSILLIFLSGCTHKIIPEINTNRFQAKQTESLRISKNYVLCKSCIKYTNLYLTKKGDGL